MLPPVPVLWFFPCGSFGNYAKREILANKHQNKSYFINP